MVRIIAQKPSSKLIPTWVYKKYLKPPTPLSCPLCAFEDLAPLGVIDSKIYWRCHECSLIFLSPHYRLDPASERSRYLLHKNHPSDLEYRKFLSRLSDQLVVKLPIGSSGLDYGSGPGPTLSVMLEEQGFPMKIYDPYFASGTEVLQDQYDFITCTETIEHFYYPEKEFLNLDRLIREGGWLGVMTEILESDDQFYKWHYHRDPTHVCFFKKHTMNWIAQRFRWRAEYPRKNIVLFQKIRGNSSSTQNL